MSTVFDHLAAAPMGRPDQYFATPLGSAAPAAAGHDGDAETPREAPHASRAMTRNLPAPTEYLARTIEWSEDATEEVFRDGFATLLAGLLGQAGSDYTLFVPGTDPHEAEGANAAGADAAGADAAGADAAGAKAAADDSEAVADMERRAALADLALVHGSPSLQGALFVTADHAATLLDRQSRPGVLPAAPPPSDLPPRFAPPSPSPMPSLQDVLLLSLILGCSAEESSASAESLAEACARVLLRLHAWQLSWTFGRRMHRALGRVFASNPRPPRK